MRLKRIAHYDVTTLLGEGGMGQVWQAHDTQLGRDVALKILPEAFAADPDRLARFKREAQILASLNHPNIAAIYGVEESGESRALVLELVDGPTLADLIAQGALPIEDALPIARQIAAALEAAHDAGVIHRDLKPANIKVREDGTAKVLDFGLAKAIQPDLEADEPGESTTVTALTLAGTVVGTLPYMSPEQIEGQSLDHRTDIFSFGVLLYEMLSGKRPFAGDTQPALMSAILKDDPPLITTICPELPRHVAHVIRRCLAKNADERYDSSRDVRSGLTALGLAGPTSVGEAVDRDPSANNLPSSLDSFVGRTDELSELADTVIESRIVTLTGVGGTGKTRMAIETASRLLPRFADGAWLAELAPVSRPQAVPYVVADAIGVVQQPGKTMAESIVESLKHRALLLILDNCEHLLDAVAGLVSAVAASCPAVRMIATSREGLAIRGERVVRLRSLSDADGADLFRDRARAAGSEHGMNPDTLARLSARLDGIPLAIELAAARCTSLSPEDIETRLDDRFRLLRGSHRGRVERHQTLRNTVAWSYDLLDDVQRHVFDRLSVFAGGFTLDAAAAVAGADDIASLDVEDAVAALVDRSMVLAVDTEDGTRYRLLETLRQFGEEQLANSGDAATVRDRHVEWFAAFMRRAWDGLWSADDLPWIRRVRAEFENLRVAVYAAIDHQDRDAIGSLLRSLSWWAWQSVRYEVGDWSEAAIHVEPEPLYARAMAVFLQTQRAGQIEDVTRLAQGMDRSPSTDLDDDCLRAWARFTLALISRSADIGVTTQQTLEAASRTGNHMWAATFKGLIGGGMAIAGLQDEAQSLSADAVESAEQSSNTTALYTAYWAMGRAYSETDPELALRYLALATGLGQRQQFPLAVNVAEIIAAGIILRSGDLERGRVRLARPLRSFMASGDLVQTWHGAHHLVYFLLHSDRLDDARAIWAGLGSRPGITIPRHRDELRERLGDPGENQLSDGEVLERMRRIMDALEAESPETNRTEPMT